MIELHRKVYVFYSCLDGFQGEVASSSRVNTLLVNNIGDICLHIENLDLPLLVSDLEISFVQNELDNFSLSLVGEVLVEVCLLSNLTMVCVLVNLIALKYLSYVVFEPVAPVNSLVSIAGDLEDLVVDLVLDEGHVGHLDDGVGLLEHFEYYYKRLRTLL